MHRKEGRDENGMFLVEGLKPVTELLASGWTICQLLITERLCSFFQPQLKNIDLAVQVIPESQMERISAHVTSPGVIAVADSLFQPQIKSAGPVLIVDGIQDPGNLGTMIRTADWFGFSQIYSTPGSVEIFNPKVVASSMGSLFRLKPQVADPHSIVRFIEQSGFKLFVSALQGSAENVDWPASTAIVIGSESHGVSPFWLQHAHQLVKIRSYGHAESLNAAIAFGILASQIRSGS